MDLPGQGEISSTQTTRRISFQVCGYNLTVRPRSSDDITNTKQSKQRTRKCIQEIYSHGDCMDQTPNFYDFKNESDNHILLKEDNT